MFRYPRADNIPRLFIKTSPYYWFRTRCLVHFNSLFHFNLVISFSSLILQEYELIYRCYGNFLIFHVVPDATCKAREMNSPGLCVDSWVDYHVISVTGRVVCCN